MAYPLGHPADAVACLDGVHANKVEIYGQSRGWGEQEEIQPIFDCFLPITQLIPEDYHWRRWSNGSV
ncbi:hypothetical protein [Nonomuraea dietziae]|nr:hypothetical protein [Nonomuraea dietziae]